MSVYFNESLARYASKLFDPEGYFRIPKLPQGRKRSSTTLQGIEEV
jgi:hypothetical protein